MEAVNSPLASVILVFGVLVIFSVGYFLGRATRKAKVQNGADYVDLISLKSDQNFSILSEDNKEALVSFIASETLLSARIQSVLDDLENGSNGEEWRFIRLPGYEDERLKGQEKILEEISKASKNRPEGFATTLLGKFNGMLKALVGVGN